MREINFRCSTPDDDAIVTEHLVQIAREIGVSEAALIPDLLDSTSAWIAEARARDRYQGFIAECDRQIIGSVGCQLYQRGYPPVIKRSVLQYGYIWGLYVEPEYRRQGIASRLMQMAVDHLQLIGCTQVLLHASLDGQPVYAKLGFVISNEMVLRLDG